MTPRTVRLIIKNKVPDFGTHVYRDPPMSALTNAIEILRCFSAARPDLSFADVMALTGKPKSSTSRLLHLQGMRRIFRIRQASSQNFARATSSIANANIALASLECSNFKMV